MRILLDEDFWPGFLPGALVHIIMVFSRIRFWSLDCAGSCDEIMYYDMPVSLFYFFFPDWGVILASLLLGSIMWGLGGYLILKLVRRIFRSQGIG